MKCSDLAEIGKLELKGCVMCVPAWKECHCCCSGRPQSAPRCRYCRRPRRRPRPPYATGLSLVTRAYLFHELVNGFLIHSHIRTLSTTSCHALLNLYDFFNNIYTKLECWPFLHACYGFAGRTNWPNRLENWSKVGVSLVDTLVAFLSPVNVL